MELFLIELVTKYPLAAGVLSSLYIAGICFKPLFGVFHKYVDATESIKDNEFLAKVEASKAYKAVAYLLDLAVRIKLPVEKK
jgi:hypothetical protein